MKNIFLIGFMGCGKSAVSAYMKTKYDLNCIDMDEEIVKKEGMSIPEIFDKKGEAYFRMLETEVLHGICAMDNVIVSCGGGVILKEDNVYAMKQRGVVVFLSATPDTILNRVKDDNSRPLLNGNKTITHIENMMNERIPRYMAAADMMIETDEKKIEDICKEILENV